MKKFDKQKITHFDIEYFRERQRNNIFQAVISHFLKKAREEGLTKKDIAEVLKKDPAQITRWLSGPGNLTLDTISDLFLAMGSEIKHEVVPVSQSAPNDVLRLKFNGSTEAGSGSSVATTRPSIKIAYANSEL